MTQVTEPYGLNADRLDSGRGPWRPVAVCLVLGLIIGALIGVGYSATRSTSYTATTALSVQPDSLVNTQLGQNAPTVDSTAFIQSQLVVLNGSQLADTVQTTLKLSSRPSVNSTQVGTSYVVQVTGTSNDRAQALAIANATASAYSTQRTTSLSASITASIKSIRTQLANTQKSLATAQAQTPLTDGLTPSETALQTEYERLLSVGSALNLALPQVGQVVTVLSPASVAPDAVSSTKKYLVGGAILGALLALVLLIGARRAFPRIRSVSDLAGLNVPVLLPVLPRHGRRDASWGTGEARVLAARLTGHGPGPSEPVIVVGATRGVGTSFVAASIAAGLVERGPVLLVLAAELTQGSQNRALKLVDGPNLPTNTPNSLAHLIRRAQQSEVAGLWVLPGSADNPELSGPAAVRAARFNEILDRATEAGWLVVLDAPALSESDLALNCAGSAGAATLVVGRGASQPSEIVSAAELFDAHSSRLAGVLLNDVPRRFSRPSPTAPVASSVPQAKATAPASGRRRAGDASRPTGAEHENVNDVVPFPPDTSW